ncbi:MAG: PH domain-containing protein [Eubacteriaceae bacterium]|nr:PH domain-containing protein [Eubacteriaceae bacterium]
MLLKPVKDTTFSKMVDPIMVDGEQIIESFQSVRDGIVFTNKRIIAIDIQGALGKKKDFTSLPYKRLQTFSVTTADFFDFNSKLELWFNGVGKVCFEFAARTDIAKICKTISSFVL